MQCVLTIPQFYECRSHTPAWPWLSSTGHPPVKGSVNNKLTDHSDTPVTAQHVTAHQDEFIDTIKSERCRFLKRIPKASRILAAEKLSTILDRIITKPDDSMLWLSILRFSRACLAVPGGRGGRRHLSSLAAKVNKALDAYLISTTQILQPVLHVRKSGPSTTDNIAARISEKLNDGDVRGVIRLAASDDLMAPHDENTLAALRLKHPQRRTISSEDPPFSALRVHSNASLIVKEGETLLKQSSRSQLGSAGGIDGMRPQHIKDMTTADTGETGMRLISRLTEFANVCLAGNVPLTQRPIFCGAFLCALNKKDGGIRPIAVGCSLRRLVAKTAAKCVQVKMAVKMAPTQLGYGVRQGTEAAAHAARRFLEDMGPGQALLKLDFVNAFNAISRDVILRNVYDELPELFQFISTCYDSASHLCFGEFLISSTKEPHWVH